MDFFALIVLLFLSIGTCFYLSSSRRRRSGKLPPGPYPFPIIGNLHQLGKKPYESLAKLSNTYGPLMSIHLGSVYAVIVSSPEIAKEMLLKQGQEFSGRTTPVAARAHDHHKASMGFLPVGDEWRKFRKVTKEQMFSNSSLEASQGLRQDKLQKLCDYVQKYCDGGLVVNITEAAFVSTMNLMSATLFSAEFSSFDSDATHEFEDSIGGLIKFVGVPNIADFIPVLKPIDPQGIKRKSDYYFGKLLLLIEGIINERLKSRSTSPKKTDLLETLLDLNEGSEYNFSINDIKHLLLDLFVGGTDTTMTSIEWIMTELLLHPEKILKVKQELKTVVGEDKLVQESDISKLPYFLAVVKETFRYHPPGPLLLPRESLSNTQINGYTIPKGTQILFNVWAMGRDPSLWPNPDCFEPERFLGKKTDFKGQDFELIPFGSGRRICPGLPLANRMFHITVATLVHKFDWKHEFGGIKQELEAEMMGQILRKTFPLKAIPIKKI